MSLHQQVSITLQNKFDNTIYSETFTLLLEQFSADEAVITVSSSGSIFTTPSSQKKFFKVGDLVIQSTSDKSYWVVSAIDSCKITLTKEVYQPK